MSESSPISIGNRFGRYVIEAVIGEGGMGRVYRARDERLHRLVALKVLRLDKTTNDSNASQDAAARMLREARAAAALDHPNAVSVFDVDESEGTLYIAMELVPGRSLRAFVGDGIVTWQQKLRWLVDVARVLGVAHDRGLVHRDVKPENVMVRDDGVVKVLDFGIAKRVKIDVTDIGGVGSAGGTGGMTTETVKGVIVGTPRYLSPEQCRGETIDARSDQFSWGVLAYELLTGDLPWKDEDSGVPLLLAIVTKEPRSLSSILPDVPAVVTATVMKALAKAPANRFPSLASIVSTLEPYVGGARRSLDDIASGPTLSPPSFQVSEPATASRTQAPKVPRRGAIVLGLGIGLAVLGASAIALRPSPSAPAAIGRGAPVDAAGPAASGRGVAITDLPIPASSAPDAVVAYRAGLQAFRDGSFDAARQSLARAVALDPTFAAAHLRASVLSSIVSSDELEARRSFRLATQNRAHLTPRDAVLLDALEPYLQRDPSDLTETSNRLAASVAKYPDDAELWYLLGWARFDRGELTSARSALAHSIDLDPMFAQAWSWKGGCESYLGLFDDAITSLDRAIEISPSGTEALWFRAMIDEQQGKCEAAEADARKWIVRDPDDYYAYQMLAKALFAQGKAIETVKAALEQKWIRLTPARRPRFELADRVRLDIMAGDFASAQARAIDLEARASSDSDALAHAEPAILLVQIHRETGHDALAKRAAEEFMLRREAWVSPHRVDDKAIFEDPLPTMLSTLAHTGAMPAATFEERRTEWMDGWRSRTSEAFSRYLWIYAYALPAESPAEAQLALSVLPKLGALPPYTPQTLAWAHVGNAYLRAGRADEALPFLERAAASCVSLYDPIVHTRALFALGQARESGGKTQEACAAYAAVVSRWGNAKPRSITGEKAKERMRALSCPK